MKTTHSYNLNTKELNSVSKNSWLHDDLYFSLNKKSVDLAEILVKLKWVNSKTQAKALINNGALEFKGLNQNNGIILVDKLENYIDIIYKRKYKYASIQFWDSCIHNKFKYFMYNIKYKIILKLLYKMGVKV